MSLLKTNIFRAIKKDLEQNTPVDSVEKAREEKEKMFSAAASFWHNAPPIVTKCYNITEQQIKNSLHKNAKDLIKTRLAKNEAIYLPPYFFAKDKTLKIIHFFDDVLLGTVRTMHRWLYFIPDPPFYCKNPVYRYNNLKNSGTGYFILVGDTLYPAEENNKPVAYNVSKIDNDPEGWNAKKTREEKEAREAKERKEREAKEQLAREIERRADEMMREEYRRRAAEQIAAEKAKNKE